MQQYIKYIDEYVNSRPWAESTKRSARSRIKSYLHGARGSLYSNATGSVVASGFYDYLIELEHAPRPNPFREERKANARKFRNAYVKRPARYTLDEVKERIDRLGPEEREKCLELLAGCMRYTESTTRDGQYITGKGDKRRRVYTERKVNYPYSYTTFYRRLRAVGLKPHDLRKVGLSEAVRRGADIFQLCELAGWSDPKTAMSYISTDENKLKELIIE